MRRIRLFVLLAVLAASQSLYAQLVTTVAGKIEEAGDQDGRALGEATFNNPHGLAVDGRGMVVVADRWNHKIRLYNPENDSVYTIAGTGDIGTWDGPGESAQFYSPWGIAADEDGVIYVADTKNHSIRKIDLDGNVTTIAGTGQAGVLDGPGPVARFSDPTGIAIHPDGTLYVCDHLGHTIRKIAPNGVVTTLAGQANVTGQDDGIGTQATFNRPYGIELDFEGNIYVADEWNHLIRKVTPSGIVTTVAGTGRLGSNDGPTDIAQFNFPYDVVITRDSIIYVMDGANRIVRRIEDGVVSTYAGEAGVGGGVDGIGIQAKFGAATAIDINHNTGEIYVGDAYNHLIRRITEKVEITLVGFPLASDDTVCIGHEATVTARPRIFVVYNFFLDGQPVQSSESASFTTLLNDPGRHAITVIGMDMNGVETPSDTFWVNVTDLPRSDFTAAFEGRSRQGLTVKFTQQSNFGKTFYWDFGDTTAGPANFSTQANPTHTYANYGSYDVKLIASNGPGCTDSVTKFGVVIFEEIDANIFVPNAFTPNDDGTNDVLYFRGRNIESLDFMVFNQWGEMIFRSESLDKGWDGTHRGRPSPPDTYVYVAKVTLLDGLTQKLSGQVTLIR
ncbi:MAG: gliding motility-associated C-terminal domain-containing protein [Bacteroidota bacterium]